MKSVDDLAKGFLDVDSHKQISVVTVGSIDGIISAAILAQALRRLDAKFSIRILKEYTSKNIPVVGGDSRVVIPLCVPTYLRDEFSSLGKSLFLDNAKTTTAEQAYLFVRALSSRNTDLSKIALISIIAKNPKILSSQINSTIIGDAGDLTTRQGPTLSPATRPLRRALEYSTTHYIPGVTGNSQGVLQLLQEANIPEDKALLELTDEEISRLVAAVTLRRSRASEEEAMLGSLYALDLFNRTEDLREISILLGSCAKLGQEDVALAYCLGNEKARIKAFEVYAQYKQEIIAGLKVIESLQKVVGKGFVIFDAKDRIKSNLLGTLCSLLSTSNSYDDGTVLIGVARTTDQTEISARIFGEKKRDVKEILETAAKTLQEKSAVSIKVFGTQEKAKCYLKKDDSPAFLSILQKNLEVEVIKV